MGEFWMKLTPQQIKEIRELHSNGESIKRLAKKYDVNFTTIYYWIDDDIRKRRTNETIRSFRKRSFWKRKKVYKSRKEYIRNYRNKRYHKDKVYREKEKKRSREYYKKHR